MKEGDTKSKTILDPTHEPFLVEVIQLESFGGTGIILRWPRKETMDQRENQDQAMFCRRASFVQV